MVLQPIHFLVWRKNGGRKPRFKHPTLDAAQQEALRLSAENPTVKFHVLAVLAEIGPAAEAGEGGDV